MLPILALPAALTLVGCGDQTNAGFGENHNYGGEDINYEESQLFYVNDTKGTLFDNETAEHFKHLGASSYLIYGAKNAEDFELAKTEIKEIREALNTLPVPADLKEKYESDLTKAEEVLPKMFEYYNGMYTGSLDKAFRTIHPEYFVELDKVQAKIDQRVAFLSESQAALNKVSKELNAKKDELKKLETKHDEQAAKWVVDNSILIPTSEISFDVYNIYNNYSDTKAECDGVWNSNASVCFNYFVHEENLGIDSDYLDEMSKEQSAQYKKMAAQFYEDGKPLATAISTLKKSLRDADNAHDKQVLLADNRFGTERQLNKELYDAKRSLRSKSKGSYSQNGKLVEPRKGRYIPTQRTVLDAYAEQLGIKKMPEATTFTPENAYKVFEALNKATMEKAVILDMDDEGQFNIEDGVKPENMYLVMSVSSGKVIGEVSLRNKEEKTVASTYFVNSGDSLLNVESVLKMFNPSFTAQIESKYHNLKAYALRNL